MVDVCLAMEDLYSRPRADFIPVHPRDQKLLTKPEPPSAAPSPPRPVAPVTPPADGAEAQGAPADGQALPGLPPPPPVQARPWDDH